MSGKARHFDYSPDEYISGVAGRLRADEQGVYWMVCSLIMSEGGPVDYDERRLATLCMVRPTDIRRIINRLVEEKKLTRSEGKLGQKRAQSEVERASNRIRSAAENGAKGGRPAEITKQIQQKGKPEGFADKKLSLTSNEQRATKEEVILGSIPKKKSPPKRTTHLPAGYAELSQVLDDERTKAVIEHRQKFKKPLTAHAAKLLARQFEKCPNPNEAADEMVARGWLGFKPEWLVERKPTGKPDPSVYVPKPPPPADPYANVFVEGFMGLHGEEELAAAKAKYIKITKGSQ